METKTYVWAYMKMEMEGETVAVGCRIKEIQWQLSIRGGYFYNASFVILEYSRY